MKDESKQIIQCKATSILMDCMHCFFQCSNFPKSKQFLLNFDIVTVSFDCLFSSIIKIRCLCASICFHLFPKCCQCFSFGEFGYCLYNHFCVLVLGYGFEHANHEIDNGYYYICFIGIIQKQFPHLWHRNSMCHHLNALSEIKSRSVRFECIISYIFVFFSMFFV